MTKINKAQEKVNAIVLEGLKKKGLNWFKPWKAGKVHSPVNWVTQKPYSGVNTFMLNAIMSETSYNTNEWLTFKQCTNANGKVLKGSKASDIFYWQVSYLDRKNGTFTKAQFVKSLNLREKITVDGRESDRYLKTFAMSNYKVFNISQCEGLDSKIPQSEDDDTLTFEPIEVADQLVKSYVDRDGKLFIQHKQDGAFYMPSRDMINMPLPETFCDPDSYYKVLFHEMVHATGHESRLNRKTLISNNGFKRVGKITYSREELVAEIGCMYMVGFLGLDPKDNDPNSQAYINGWLSNLKKKPQEIATAMTQASKAFDELCG